MMGGFADSGWPITQKGSVQRRERAALGTRLATHPHTRHVLLSARDGEMFDLGADGARVHSCTHSSVSHMAKINTQRMEWGIMIAAINAAATNSAIATLVLSLVGLWVITQLRIWRYVPRTSPRVLPSREQGGLRVLRGQTCH
jgi:hypothetical protein